MHVEFPLEEYVPVSSLRSEVITCFIFCFEKVEKHPHTLIIISIEPYHLGQSPLVRFASFLKDFELCLFNHCKMGKIVNFFCIICFQGRVIFLIGSQCTQIRWIWEFSLVLDIRLRCIPYLARGLESVLHLYSVGKFVRNRKPPLKCFLMNACLRFLDASMETKKGVHVLLFQSTGLCY